MMVPFSTELSKVGHYKLLQFVIKFILVYYTNILSEEFNQFFCILRGLILYLNTVDIQLIFRGTEQANNEKYRLRAKIS